MEGHGYGLRHRCAAEERTAVELTFFKNDPSQPLSLISEFVSPDFEIKDYSFYDEKSKEFIDRVMVVLDDHQATTKESVLAFLKASSLGDTLERLIRETNRNHCIFEELGQIYRSKPSALIKKLDIDVHQHGFAWACPLQIDFTLDLVFNKAVVSVKAPFIAYKGCVMHFPSCDVPQATIEDFQRLEDHDNIHVVVFHGKWCRFVISALDKRAGFRLFTKLDLEDHEINQHLKSIFPSLPKYDIVKEQTLSEIIAHVPFETNTLVIKDIATNFFDHVVYLNEVSVVSSKKNVTVKGFVPKAVAEKQYNPATDELEPVVMSVNPMDSGLKVRFKRVKDSSLQNSFKQFVIHLVSFIEEKQHMILKDYFEQTGINVPVVKMKKRSNNLPQDGLFITNFSRICKKELQPIIISEEEALNRNMVNVLRFPKHMMYNVPPRYYTCPKNYHIGLKPNSLANKDAFPLVPVCFTTPQIGKQTVTDSYINGLQEEKQLNNVSKRFAPLQKEKTSSMIPDTLQTYLRHIFSNESDTWIRTFCGRDYLKSLFKLTRNDLAKWAAFGQAQFPGESESTIKNVIASTPFLSTVKFKKIIEAAAQINVATFVMNEDLEISFGTESYQDELFDNYYFGKFIIVLEFSDRNHVEVVHVDKKSIFQTKASALMKMFRDEGRSHHEFIESPKQIVNAYGYVVSENSIGPIHPRVPIEFEKRKKGVFDDFNDKKMMSKMLFGAFCHAKLIYKKTTFEIDKEMSLGNEDVSNLFSDCPFLKIGPEKDSCSITVPNEETFLAFKSFVDLMPKSELNRFRFHNPILFVDQTDFKRGKTINMESLNARMNGFGAIEVLSVGNMSTARKRKLMQLDINDLQFNSKYVFFNEKPSNYLMRNDINCLFFDQMRREAVLTKNNESDVFFTKIDPVNDSTGPSFSKRNLFSAVIDNLDQALDASDPDNVMQIVEEEVIEQDEPIFFENSDSQEDPKKKD